jgi:hypothetical protein
VLKCFSNVTDFQGFAWGSSAREREGTDVPRADDWPLFQETGRAERSLGFS